MRIQAINIYYKYNNISSSNQRVTKPVQSVNFKGFFSHTEPTLQGKFEAGLKALGDEKSILVVTNNKDSADFYLKELYNKIDIPIENMYTLEFPYLKEEDSTSFVIFKKNNQFCLMNINSLWQIKVFNPNIKSHPEDGDSVEKGSVRILNDKEAIFKKTTFCTDDKTPFIFKTPTSYSKEFAKSCLEYKTIFENKDKIDAHNKTTIFKFLMPDKKINSTQKEITFADIGGLDGIIEDLKKYVLRPINYPQAFEILRLNKGVLLSGPPRCGKTLLGKALANEAGINYKYMNANEFTMGIYGASEEKARGIFDGIMKEPTILFIDEIDAIGKERTGGHNAQYDDKFLTQLLGSMSDLEKSETMSFVIAATNRKDLLDTALIETGRFGLHLDVPLPNEEGLEAIYNVHAKKKPFEDDVNVKDFVPFMFENKFNGSDVAEIITNGYFNALERLGMNAKMDAKTFTYNDLKAIKISKDDIWSAMRKLAMQKSKIRI